MSSLRTLASDLGLSRATVSAALRGLPGVKPVTRERVLRAASRQGYQINPLASALMGSMRRARAGVFRGTIAVLRLEPRSGLTRETARAQNHVIEGLTERSLKFGFVAEVFQLGERGLTWDKLPDVLRNRGVRGVVVLAPEQDDLLARVNWRELPAVGVGAISPAHGLSSVSVDHLEALDSATRELRKTGCERFGLLLHARHSAESRRRWIGAFHAVCGADTPASRPFIVESEAWGNFQPWIERERVQMVLAATDSRPPIEDLGRASFCPLDLAPDVFGALGVDQGHLKQGAKAMDLIIERLLRHESSPGETCSTLLPACWRDGPQRPATIPG